jgi:ABC-type sugar transport system ATPase subunit
MNIPAAALRVVRPVAASPERDVAAGTDYVVVDRVSKVYNEGTRQQVEAVAPSSFAIKAGEFVALLGPSGCGKSTLLMMIAGLDAPSQGTIGIAGHALTQPRAETGIMFQDPTLLPWKSALDNVLFPFQAAKRSAGPTGPPPCSTRSASAASTITSRASSPAACASASPSVAPWSTSPTCC